MQHKKAQEISACMFVMFPVKNVINKRMMRQVMKNVHHQVHHQDNGYNFNKKCQDSFRFV